MFIRRCVDFAVGCLAVWMAGWTGIQARCEVTNLTVSADSCMFSELINNNGGAIPHVAAGSTRVGNMRRGLFRFDVSTIPVDAVITSAVFRVDVIKQPAFSTPQPSQFTLHRLNADWREGVGGGVNLNKGSTAQADESTWRSRMHGSALWSTAGAAADAEATPSAMTQVSGLGAYSWSGSGLLADVQAWVDGTAMNLGWLFRSQSEGVNATAREFGSREGGGPAVLEVGFIPPPSAPDITIREIAIDTNRHTSLTWIGAPGWQYDLLADNDLTDGQDFTMVQPNIRDSGTGTNSLANLPVFVDPVVPANARYSLALQARPQDTNVLPIILESVATNLISPVVLTSAHDGSGRLFVAEQTGEIRILDTDDTVLAAPFLDLSDKMTNLAAIGIGGVNDPGLNPIYDERGLLGLVFHPDYVNNGRFFVYYSSPNADTNFNNESILAEYQVSVGDPNLADPLSERILLRQDEPEFNHNAGQLAFGPDGYLYVSLGDGGGAGDQHGPLGNAQITSVLLGSILRLDVDGAQPYAIPPDNPFVGQDGRDEIYAYGFRNPFRFSFDRGGDNALIVPDVGQNIYEEINIVVKGGNYGWRIIEGTHGFDLPLAETLGVDIFADVQYPIHEYSHAEAGISIIGGFMYRGSDYPELVGKYVFGDFSDSFGAPGGRIYYLDETRPGIWERFQFRIEPGDPPLGRYVKAFGEDENGELYLLAGINLGPSGTSGEILRLRKP